MESEGPSGAAEGAEVELALAAAGWGRVLDDLLRGVCHDLNGRVSSLEGLLMLLGLDERDTPVVPFLESEAGRLADVVQVARSLTGDPGEPAEPILAADVLERVRHLHPRHRGLETVTLTVDVAEALPPFRAGPVRVGRLLLVLLSRAGKAALDSGGRAVRVAATSEAPAVAFAVGPWADGWVGWDPGALERLDEVAGADGGAVELRGPVVRVAYPALTRPGG